MEETIKQIPKTFISYSWDNQQHVEWVRELADRLVRYGLDVILDQYELEAGKDINYFMETAMLADRIILIMTPNYKLKADKRTGGVGYEYSMISKQLYDAAPDTNKIIPILRSGDTDISCPSYLQTKMFHNMTQADQFELRFMELTKIIQRKPLIPKPPLGTLPENTKAEDLTSETEQALKDLKIKEAHIANKRMKIDSHEGVNIFNSTVYKILETIDKLVENYKNNFQFYFHTKKNPTDWYLLSTVNFTAQFSAHQVYNNTAIEAYITLQLYRGPFGLNRGIDYNGPVEEIYIEKYKFDLDENMDVVFCNFDRPTIKLKPDDIPTILLRDIVTKEINLRRDKLE